MNVHRRWYDLSCLSAMLSGLSFAAAEGSPGLALATVSMTGFAWGVGRNGRPPRLPKSVVNLLVIAAIVWAVASATALRGETPMVSVLGSFLCFLQLVKLLDRREPRDEVQVLSLSVFVAIATILTSNMLLPGLLLILYMPVATAAAMLLQLDVGRRSADACAGSADARSGVHSSGSNHHGETSKVFPGLGKPFASVLTATFVTSSVLGAVVFVVTPRGLGEEVFGSLGIVPSGTQIGFRDEVQLDRGGFLQRAQSQRPVLDVRWTDEEGRPLGGSGRVLYLRGAVLDRWRPEGQRWVAPSSEPNTYTLEPDVQQILTDERLEGPQVSVIDVSVRGSISYLFTTWLPGDVQISREQTVRHSRPGHVMQLTERTRPGMRYRIRATPGELIEDDPPGQIEPSNFDERIGDLASDILTQAGLSGNVNQWDRARARSVAITIRDHLRENYAYTLEMAAPPPGEDAISFFLFTRRMGHCEYFASAMAAMLQSLGVGARVVVGYLATEYSRGSGVYEVRESNAHAWVEVHLGGGVWTTMDPSPPGDIERIHSADGLPLLTRFRRWYDSLQFGWTSAIVSFDRQSQTSLFGSIGDGDRSGFWSSMRDANHRIGRLIRSIGEFDLADTVAGAVYAAIAAIFLATGFFLVRKHFLRRGSRSSARRKLIGNDAELQALLHSVTFYDRLLDLLERAGLGRPEAVPALVHARGLRRELQQVVSRLTTTYYGVRFARRPLTHEQRKAAESDLEEVRRILLGPAHSSPTAGQ